MHIVQGRHEDGIERAVNEVERKLPVSIDYITVVYQVPSCLMTVHDGFDGELQAAACVLTNVNIDNNSM
jgi:hypothetical protein